MIKKILLLSFLSVLSSLSFAEKPLAPATLDGATLVTAEEVIELITGSDNVVVIDARRDEEYEKGHIETAITLLDSKMTELNLSSHAFLKETPIVFYCNGIRCLRSYNASVKALSWGYTNVYWFRGGWKEWTAKDLPISR
jgi:rhodanese-related sulfurtransferase